MSDSVNIVIGVMARLRKELREGVPLETALAVVAAELEKGLALRSEGKTKSLLPSELRAGKLIGDPK